MTKMEYILLAKKQDAAKSDKAVKQDIKKVFGSTNNDTFNVTIKHTDVELHYTIEKRNIDNAEGSAYYISLFANGKNKQKLVEALEYAHLRMMQDGEIRKNYHIVILFDDVSSYYCVKAYPIFHEYEKQIRRLIYKYLTMSLGTMWIDKTVDEELRNLLKERTKGISSEKLIAQMLHEMDMSQLEQYLFEPKREISASDMIDKHLSDENIKSMTKEQMAVFIQRARPQSVWEKYFATHIEIEDLQSKMSVIRVNRNKVAHCKPFYSSDFYNSMKILKEDGLINELVNAIEKLETRELSLVTMQDVLHGLEEFGNFFKAAAVIVSPALIELANFMQNIRNNIVIPGIINPLVEALERQKQINEVAMNPVVASIAERTQSVSSAIDFSHLNALSKQMSIAESLMNNPLMESLQKAEQLNRLYNPPLLEALRRENEIRGHIANSYTMGEYSEEFYPNEENSSDVEHVEKDDLE